MTPKEEALIANYLANGFNGVQAARDAGYKGNDNVLAVTAHRVLRKAKVVARVRERLDGLHANADEVLNLLADHMRADLADFDGCFDEEGRLDLKEAKRRGVSRLVKKLKSRRVPVKGGDGKIVDYEHVTELEFHDSQSAAKTLADILGIKQQPRENEHDGQLRNERDEALKILAEYKAVLNGDEAQAKAMMAQDVPFYAKHIN